MALFDQWRKLVGLDMPEERLSAPGGSTGLGPDYPHSPGDRERGKFRVSQSPRLVQQAVCNDDGTAVSASTDVLLKELIEEVRQLRLALMSTGVAADPVTSDL